MITQKVRVFDRGEIVKGELPGQHTFWLSSVMLLGDKGL